MFRARNIFIAIIVLIVVLFVGMRVYGEKTTFVVEISYCDGRQSEIDSVAYMSLMSPRREVISIDTYKQSTPTYSTRNKDYINVCSVKIIRERKWR